MRHVRHRAGRALACAALAACDAPDPTTTVGPSTSLYEDSATGTTDTESTPGEDTGPRLAQPLEICVNEFMPANAASWKDEQEAFSDWIELHNPGAEDVDLRGWALTDDRGDPEAHVFRDVLIVPAGGFLVLSADDQPELGPTHLSFSLSADGEDVALFRHDGSAEIIGYGAVVSDLAVARDADCGPLEGWSHVFVGTPGAPNTP